MEKVGESSRRSEKVGEGRKGRLLTRVALAALLVVPLGTSEVATRGPRMAGEAVGRPASPTFSTFSFFFVLNMFSLPVLQLLRFSYFNLFFIQYKKYGSL